MLVQSFLLNRGAPRQLFFSLFLIGLHGLPMAIYIPHPVLLLRVLEGWALRGRTMKMFVAAKKETHSFQTQPPETASCVLLWGHLSVVLPGLREVLRLSPLQGH